MPFQTNTSNCFCHGQSALGLHLSNRCGIWATHDKEVLKSPFCYTIGICFCMAQMHRSSDVARSTYCHRDSPRPASRIQFTALKRFSTANNTWSLIEKLFGRTVCFADRACDCGAIQSIAPCGRRALKP